MEYYSLAIKLICSDFDGVLSNVDRDFSKNGWYSSLREDDKILSNDIQNFLFKSNRKFLISSWMSGEINYKDINAIIANRFDFDYSYLEKQLINSAKKLKLNWNLIETYQKHRKNGVKVVLTTDNMDIFSLYTVKENNLNVYFDNIYNSFDLKSLKTSNEFELYKNIAKENNIELYEILIVDDGEKMIEKAKSIGFTTYLYNQSTYFDFERDLCKILLC